jgi:DNA-binding MarR family transcriptional regulator
VVGSPSEKMLDELVELSRLVVGVAYRSLDGLDPELDLVAFRALAHLDRNSGCTMGVLATGISVPASSATRLCDRLVDHGWITRHHNPDNRRQVELALTAAGLNLVRAALSARRAELSRIASRLSREQRSALGHLLPDLVVAAAACEPEGSPAWAV